ncbi:putative transferase [Porphyridium purpureum]|uniref:Putative transferase n=1 Tax=Porphyridium purpureum TaxID=35688 RepID=A0A5J4YNF3_PORPP|nr:putative transferase [Porphyridium purpureum]|eukprot:POR9273..scf249_10
MVRPDGGRRGTMSAFVLCSTPATLRSSWHRSRPCDLRPGAGVSAAGWISARSLRRARPSTLGLGTMMCVGTARETFVIAANNVGFVELSGGDAVRFLHSRCTSDLQTAVKSATTKRSTADHLSFVCTTLVTSNTGRMVDLVSILLMNKGDAKQHLLLMTSAARTASLVETFDKFIFPMDDVSVRDASGEYAAQYMMNQTQACATDAEALHFLPFGNRVPLACVVKATKDEHAAFESTGHEALYDLFCVEYGIPRADREITEAYNPLEAGLWQFVSFSKGCYCGQETIARLNTYNGVKQHLVGLKFEGSVDIPPGSPLFAAASIDESELEGSKPVGIITSSNGTLALGYVRTRALGNETELLAKLSSETSNEGKVTPDRYCRVYRRELALMTRSFEESEDNNQDV